MLINFSLLSSGDVQVRPIKMNLRLSFGWGNKIYLLATLDQKFYYYLLRVQKKFNFILIPNTVKRSEDFSLSSDELAKILPTDTTVKIWSPGYTPSGAKTWSQSFSLLIIFAIIFWRMQFNQNYHWTKFVERKISHEKREKSN